MGVTLQADYFSEIAMGVSIRCASLFAGQPILHKNHPPYQLANRITDRVNWAIEQAFENHLVVVINIHHYNEVAADPVRQRERFLAIWRQLADRYRDQPDTLYFEILNEPHDNLSGATWQSL